MPRILPSVTTIKSTQSTWQDKISEIQELDLKEVALFLTGLDPQQREMCIELLHQIPSLSIPFVHTRSDMLPEEYEYLMGEFGTERFNLHPLRSYPLKHPLSQEIKSRVYIENSMTLQESDLEGFGGICLDISHLEESRLLEPSTHKNIVDLLHRFPVGANHISEIRKEAEWDHGHLGHSLHFMRDLSELDYLERYPLNYFSDFAAIELKNNLSEQLKVKEKIEEILAKKTS